MGKRRWKIIAVLVLGLVAYLATYVSLLKCVTIQRERSTEGPLAYMYMSGDPLWNDVGYYVYFPIHAILHAALGEEYVYLRDSKDLNRLVNRRF